MLNAETWMSIFLRSMRMISVCVLYRQDVRRLPCSQGCLQWGISHEEWGIWGGIYLEAGQKSEEFNEHKTDEVWDELLVQLTHDTGQNYE